MPPLKVSKFRSALVKGAKRDGWYSDIAAGALNTDADHIKASGKFIAFTWDGTGTLAVVPLERIGKVDRSTSLIRGHTDFVSDFAFAPFDDHLLATGSNDATVALWNIPHDGLTESLSTPLARFSGHGARIESLTFHPTASGLLAAAAGAAVKLWDVEKSSVALELASQHPEAVQGLSWKADGTVFATVSKDRHLRVVDPRSASVAASVEAHAGSKTIRVTWAGDHDRIFTTGFSKSRDRQYAVWDSRDLSKPLSLQSLDSSTGVLIPMFDEDTNVLVLAGKGDSTLRYMELTENKPYLTEGTASVNDPPQMGATLVPKRALDVMGCEVWRVLKLTKEAVVPVSYEISRKSHLEFQEDLYPDTKGTTPALTAAQWLAGENGSVAKVSLDPSKSGSKKKSAATPASPATSALAAPAASASSSLSSPASAPAAAKSTAASASAPNSASTSAAASAPEKASVPQQSYAPSEKAAKALSIVRSSKYRHVNGTVMHKKNNIDDLSQLNSAIPGESNLFEGNNKYLCVPVSGPGGQLAIFETLVPRRLARQFPTLQNVSTPLDYNFDPFDNSVIAVGCEDALVRIWKIPEGGLKETLSEPHKVLRGHEAKVNLVRFHPTVRNLLVTASYDFTLRYWDVSTGEQIKSIGGHSEQIFSVDFSADGKLLATFAKDKQLRLFDARTGNLLCSTTAHEGTRGGRVLFLEKTGLLLTSGFDKSSQRQVRLFKISDLSEVGSAVLDVSPGILVPVYDEDTTLLYLCGRGDTGIVTFEIDASEAPFLHPATPFKSSEQQQGIVFFPKASCNVAEVEVAKAAKLTKTYIEYISFQIPRTRKEFFQDDLFPETRVTSETNVDAKEWLGGKDVVFKFVSLKPASMTALSQAPKEQPKESKFLKYNPATQDSPDKTKEKLLSSMADTLGNKTATPLFQDTVEGVAEEEWNDY